MAIQVASDKSISHRALIFAALAEGRSEILNPLLSEDVLCTLQILRQLGVKIEILRSAQNDGRDALIVQGVGLKGLKPSSEVLYCGNSGTTMRLMLGLLSAQNFESVLTGDDSLNKRPMDRVMDPLKERGAQFEVEHNLGKRLITIMAATEPLKDLSYSSPVASAQVKTCLILAGLCSGSKTVVTEPSLSRNHTELMLSAQGVGLKSVGEAPHTVTVEPTERLQPLNLTVPADISSAAFFMVAGSIVPGSEIVLMGVNLNPTRTGILDALLKMNANIEIQNARQESGEEVADLKVSYAKLQNQHFGGSIIPRLIDEIPILCLAATQGEGEFEISDARELRVKETDRIAAVASNLQAAGVKVITKEDGLVIPGGQVLKAPKDQVDWQTFHDHRIAMMGAIANLVSQTPIVLDNNACIQTSFPNFFELLESFASRNA